MSGVPSKQMTKQDLSSSHSDLVRWPCGSSSAPPAKLTAKLKGKERGGEEQTLVEEKAGVGIADVRAEP